MYDPRMPAPRRDRGNPTAALALIASIFAVGFVIKLLPPPAREALLDPVAHRDLPSRALLVWSPSAPPAFAVQASERRSRSRAVAPIVNSLPRSAQREGGEPTGDVLLTFDRDPGEAPRLPATLSKGLTLPMAIDAVHAQTEIGDSRLAAPFTKTGSALRVAFVKTGSAIKAAASGTAGVFVSNP